MRPPDRIEVQLGKIVLSYDTSRPIKAKISPADAPVHISVLDGVEKLVRLVAFRFVHPELTDGMLGIRLNDRIRRELIGLREMGESDIANEVMGYYQKLTNQR